MHRYEWTLGRAIGETVLGIIFLLVVGFILIFLAGQTKIISIDGVGRVSESLLVFAPLISLFHTWQRYRDSRN